MECFHVHFDFSSTIFIDKVILWLANPVCFAMPGWASQFIVLWIFAMIESTLKYISIPQIFS